MENRIDKEMVERKLVNSRTKSQELIKGGFVLCNGKKITKESYKVNETDNIIVLDNDTLKYVSRGGLKLEKAINSFNINFAGKNVMDIGSSTGGFTDCSLQNGARSVIAVDVGSNLMNEKLKKDSRVTLFEKTNAVNLSNEYYKNIDIITIDVSFVSIKRIIDKIKQEEVKVDLICLIKPQFECGKEIADKYKGIIHDKNVHIKILNDLIEYFYADGFAIINLSFSPIRGGDGNIEYISYFSNKHNNKNNSISVRQIVENAFA